jgi:hypothetical protein
VAVVAVAIPLVVDAEVMRLSAAGLFFLAGILTAIGLWLFLPAGTRRRGTTLRTRAVTTMLGALFVLGTTISALALHGFAAIALATASLVPLALAYVVLRRGVSGS